MCQREWISGLKQPTFDVHDTSITKKIHQSLTTH